MTVTNAVQAQSNFLGYYYPDNNYWVDERQRYTGPGRPNFMETRLTAPAYKTAPAAVPVVPRARRARICLEVPDAKAMVWIENLGTKSTGTSRNFETPPIAEGAVFKYRLKVSWKESGQDFTLEREVTVAPGQTLDVDFAQTAALLRKTRAASVAHRP